MQLTHRNEKYDQQFYQQVIKLLGIIEMPYQLSSKSELWNGSYLSVGLDCVLLVHEIAHWMVATPHDRQSEYFGFDPGLPKWKLTSGSKHSYDFHDEERVVISVEDGLRKMIDDCINQENNI